ncbi:hypothetical protein CKAH01_04552 [Colletotrichum kahawae]|uniref:Uncharacterized protein n=1 Tax=Colletotrichum kahawae TaxID=34407 RepID=A0AAD9YH76_COLKA|nr:hypothetical protein CKAH01_04552 [Colletotrichum kahawae]
MIISLPGLFQTPTPPPRVSRSLSCFPTANLALARKQNEPGHSRPQQKFDLQHAGRQQDCSAAASSQHTDVSYGGTTGGGGKKKAELRHGFCFLGSRSLTQLDDPGKNGKHQPSKITRCPPHVHTNNLPPSKPLHLPVSVACCARFGKACL